MAKEKASPKRTPAKKKAATHSPFKAGLHILPDGAKWEIKEGGNRKGVGKRAPLPGKSGPMQMDTIRHECESVCVKMGKDGNCLKWQTICHRVT